MRPPNTRLTPTPGGAILGIDPDGIWVRVPEVGGAFGTKGQFYPEYPLVAAVAQRLGRPAAWLETRIEHLLCGTHGRAQHQDADRWRRGREDPLGDHIRAVADRRLTG